MLDPARDDAPPAPRLTAADRAFFAEHGWVVVRGLIPPVATAALEAAFDLVLPPAAYVVWGDRLVEIAGISRYSPALDAQVRDPALAAVAGELLDAASVQLLQDTALVKPTTGAARLAWHQDYSYLTYLDRPAVVTARIALTPCTVASGCLRVVDGSHRWGLHGDDLTFRTDAVADTRGALPPELLARMAADERTVELAPGDVSFHGCLTFHGSDENTSDQPRKTLAVRYLDGGCRLLPDRLPSPELRAIFTTDDDGHLTGPSFPVLWRR